jgi:hypothetical protein
MSDLVEARTFAGLLLAGAGAAGVILVGPTAFVPPAIWNGSQDVALKLIAEHPVIWRVANAGFVIATVMTAAGLFALPDVVGSRGTPFATAAAVTFALAASLWIVTLAIRLTITPAVASTFVSDGTIDPAYGPLTRLGDALFVAFIFIGSASVVALGAALVLGGALSAVVGWAVAIAGLLIIGSYVWFGDTLPAFIYVPTIATGIALLLAGR